MKWRVVWESSDGCEQDSWGPYTWNEAMSKLEDVAAEKGADISWIQIEKVEE